MRNVSKRVTCGAVVVGLGVVAVSDAHAIIIRHDLSDTEYVVADADYPALVDLFRPGDCIGTLVHESYLLTVAHCAQDLRDSQALDVNGVSHDIAEIILHPEWRGWLDDIALVRFEEPVKGVAPLPIYRGTDELGSVITLVGRGVTATGLDGERGAESDGKLRRATNVVSGVDDDWIEIFFEEPGEDGILDLEGVGAAGDSGCPGFVDVDGVLYIAGLNSWGDGGAGIGVGEYGSRDYQTRVSQHLEWLDGEVDFPKTEDPEEADDPTPETEDTGDTGGSSSSGDTGEAGEEPSPGDTGGGTDSGDDGGEAGPGAGDAGETSEEDAEGCGCTSTGSSGGQGAAIAGLLLFGLTRRRQGR